MKLTVAYIIIGALFAALGGEPALMAATFWWSIAILNEVVK